MNASEIARLKESVEIMGTLGRSSALSLLTALEQSQAALAEAQKQRDSLIVEVSQWARKAGEAQGKLEASEMAGVVKSWKDECDALRARLEAAKERLAEMADADKGPALVNPGFKWCAQRARAAIAEMEK